MFRKITYLIRILLLQAVLLLLASSAVFAHHGADQGQPAASQANADTTAEYTVTFNATWSDQTHPDDDFPSSNPHFSGLVGAMHNDQVTFWAEGQIATPGIESMAETGSKSAFLTEIDAAIEAGTANLTLSGGGIGLSPGSVSMGSFSVNQSHSKMTLVSMIAPSPDWFVGVNGLSLVDANGDWINNLVVELYPYDSGTDDGSDYASGNADSVPREPIKNFTSVAPFSDKPIGTFTISRVLQPKVEILSPASGLTIEAGEAITLSYSVSDLPSNADHVHLYINGELQGPFYDYSAPIPVMDLPIGTHQLSIGASEVNHDPLPGIADSITVTVVAAGSTAPVPQPTGATLFLPMILR